MLLPGILYLGARWYLGHRIRDAIAAANEGSSSLTVGDYSYGLFPLYVTAHRLDFDQQRESFTARGRLSRLEVDGLHLWSLISADPLRLRLIRLTGLDAAVKRIPTAGSDSSTFRLEVEEIDLDSINLHLQDAQRDIRLTDFALSLQSFRLPFQPTGVRSVRVSGDSVRYYDRREDLRITAGGLGYGSGTESIAIAELRVRRDSATDLRARGLTLAGLNARDLEETLYLDTLRIEELGGGARVPENAGDEASSSSLQTLSLGALQLPRVDVHVSGAFGRATFAGRLDAAGLQYRDSLRLDRLEVTGDTVTFADGAELALGLRDVRLVQENLVAPFAPGGPGPTRLAVPAFTVTTGPRRITGRELSYGSEGRTLSLENVRMDGGGTAGAAGRLTVNGVDRAALLRGEVPELAEVVAGDLDLKITTSDGGHYRVRAPEVRAEGVLLRPAVGARHITVADANFERAGSDGRVDMRGAGIYVNQYGLSLPFRYGSLGTVRLRMDRLRMLGNPETPIDYLYRNLAFDSRRGVLTLDSLQRVTQLTPDQLFGRAIEKSWMNFAFDSVRLTGIRADSLFTGDLVYIDSLTAGDFRLMVVEDLNLTIVDPEKPMPIQALRKLGPRVVLNRARFASTDIAYGVVDSLMEPKTIRFSGGTVRISGLDTAPSETDSVLATIDATFEKTTPLHAEFRLGRGTSGRDYSARGRLGAYDLSRVNPLMRVAADAIIETGHIQELTYESWMRRDTIRGEMSLLYRDLDLKVVGGGAWIKNLLSGVVVKNENRRGEDYRPGRIYHEHDPTKSFFNSYWKALVSGMRSSALSDIALPDELE